MTRIVLVFALVVAPSLAFAQKAGEEPTFDSLSMDRFTPRTTVGIDFGYEVWDEGNDQDITVIGMSVGGHVVNAAGLGGYVTVPLSYIDVRYGIPPFVIDDSDLALGNIEVGGIFTKWLGPSTALVMHGGVALPTASEEGASALQIFASVPRYGDLVHRVIDTTWLRLGVSPMGRSGMFLWRADLGLDLELDDDDGAASISPVFRLNVGGGIDLGSAQILGELVTNIIDSDDDNGDESASTFTLGARFLAGSVRPGVGLLFPVDFDDPFIDQLDFAVVLSLAIHPSGR